MLRAALASSRADLLQLAAVVLLQHEARDLLEVVLDDRIGGATRKRLAQGIRHEALQLAVAVSHELQRVLHQRHGRTHEG